MQYTIRTLNSTDNKGTWRSDELKLYSTDRRSIWRSVRIERTEFTLSGSLQCGCIGHGWKKVEKLYCTWKPRVLGLLSCSRLSIVLIFILLRVLFIFLFLFYFNSFTFCTFPVFSFLLRCSWFSWGCSGFFGGVPECSLMFRCSVFRVPVFVEVLQARALQ